jgi:hypothetical protein
MLAVMAVFALALQAEVTLYEGFDYTAAGDDLDGKGGTTESGFAAGSTWEDSTTYGDACEANIADGNLSCSAYTLSSSGNNASSHGGDTWSGGFNKRGLSAANTIDLDADKTFYASALFRVNGSNSLDLQFGDYDSTTDPKIKVRLYPWGGDDNDYLAVEIAGASTWVNIGKDLGGDQTWFVIMKVQTSATESDTVSACIYGDGDTVPAAEPGTWTAVKSTVASGTLSHLTLAMGSGDYGMDEIRMGETWGDVAVPEPATMVLLGIGGLGVLLRRKRR